MVPGRTKEQNSNTDSGRRNWKTVVGECCTGIWCLSVNNRFININNNLQHLKVKKKAAH